MHIRRFLASHHLLPIIYIMLTINAYFYKAIYHNCVDNVENLYLLILTLSSPSFKNQNFTYLQTSFFCVFFSHTFYIYN
jgi:hypothetical protein